MINPRLQVYVGDENSPITLTPSHFLTLNLRIGIPKQDTDNDDFNPSDSSTVKLLPTWKRV